jgi:hypothetical protein
MPPTGGFGGNTGVADAHNLAWKLAMVADGTAGVELLDSYDVERRPVSDLIVEQAYTRYVLRVDPSLSREDLAPPLDDAAIELGTIYRSAAVLPDPGGEPPAAVEDPRQPSGRPGIRAPHLPVHREGVPTSVHDVMGRGFVLLTGTGGENWCRAAADVGTALGVHLEAHRIGPDEALADQTGAFPDTYGVAPDGAVIVRPDGVVAWRAAGAVEDPRAELEQVMRRLLFR